MMKYPIGVQSFEKIREDGFAYVDKTDLIYRLTHEGNIYFLSRPRRFGKSLLVSTLKNYFLGRKELFEGLAISSLEKEWLEYPVFHIDFNGSNFTDPGALDLKIENYISEWEGIYGGPDKEMKAGDRFACVLKKAHERTGRRCVVLIDEYDKPMLDVLDTGYTKTVDGKQRLLEEWNRDVLKGFYSVFKAADADLQFVLLTGVTKFAQVSVFSGFNQPQDISMASDYETLCGITQEELESYFAEPIDVMAASFGESREEMLSRLKRHYDGYHFSERMTDVYNPFSLLNAFAQKAVRDYWFASGTPTYLIRLLSHSDENLDELTGKYYDPSQFVDYKADVEKPLPMIYQSGYLTIKDYDRDTGTFLLDLPNNEVQKGFVSLIASDYFQDRRNDFGGMARILYIALRDGDPDRMRGLLASFLADIPYTMRRREDERERERYFQYTFYLIFRMIGVYAVIVEKPQSQGRVDCIVETPKYVYIFEFKLDGTADEALAQIEAKGYARPYAADSRTVHCIGVSFSLETGTIGEWKSLLLK